MMTRHFIALAATATLLSTTAALAQTEMAWVNVDGTMVQVNYALAGEACEMDDATVMARMQAMNGGGAMQEGGANLSDESTADASTLNETGAETDAAQDLAEDVAATTESTGMEGDTADLGAAVTADASTLNETGAETDAAQDLAEDVAATTDTAMAAETTETAGTVPMQALCAISQNKANELGFPTM